MQVSVENISDIERKIKITLPADSVDPKVTTRLEEFAKTARVEGFRKGKLTPRALRTLSYGKMIRQQVVDEMSNTAFQDACKEHSLQPASQAELHYVQNQEGAAVECEFKLEVMPEITFTDLSTITLDRETAEVKELDIEKTIKGMREQQIKWSPVDNKATEIGDRITVDFRGSIDGVVFSGGEGTDMPVILGKNQVIPDFEKGLLGVKQGEEKTFPVKFPDDYGAKELAGKQAEFWIKANEIAAPELPELDDAFAEKMGIKEGGLQKLRDEIKQAMLREVKRITGLKLKNVLLEKMLELHPVTLPPSLVEAEAKQIQLDAMDRMKQQMQGARSGVMPDLKTEFFMDEAKRRVHMSVILSTVIKQRKIELDQEKLREKLREFAEMYEDVTQAQQMLLRDKNRIAELQSSVLEEQIVDALLAEMKIVDKVVGYEDFVRQ